MKGMVDMIGNLSFLCQNIHKSRKVTHDLLEQYADSADIIFIQEAYFSTFRHTTSTMLELGDPVTGPIIHAAWQEVHLYDKYPSTQVCIYVCCSMLNCFRLSAHTDPTPDPNVLILTLADRFTHCEASVVCIYNTPKTNDRAIKALPCVLPSITNLALLQGDFNLHSPAWDPNAPCSSEVADDLLTACTLVNLSLVNDNGTPTWHHRINTSSILDLLFVVAELLGRHPCTFESDHTNCGASDHSIFRCHFGRKQNTPHSAYIRQESDEELAFIADTKAMMLCNDLPPQGWVQERFDQLHSDLCTVWDKHAKIPREHTNPTRWWTPECELTKQIFEESRDNADLKIYHRTVWQACKAFFNKKVKMMTSSNHPWQGVKWTGPRCPLSFATIWDSQGCNITDPDRLFDHVHEHFNSTVASSAIDWDIVNSLPDLPEHSCPPISMAEIMECLALTSNTSAPGGDHLTWRHLKLIFDNLPELTALADLFNAILDSSIWPSQLKTANSVIIPKPKKE